ncbi:MAG: hypothetical protein R3C10_06600 [Pirellulales bacterium]
MASPDTRGAVGAIQTDDEQHPALVDSVAAARSNNRRKWDMVEHAQQFDRRAMRRDLATMPWNKTSWVTVWSSTPARAALNPSPAQRPEETVQRDRW